MFWLEAQHCSGTISSLYNNKKEVKGEKKKNKSKNNLKLPSPSTTKENHHNSYTHTFAKLVVKTYINTQTTSIPLLSNIYNLKKALYKRFQRRELNQHNTYSIKKKTQWFQRTNFSCFIVTTGMLQSPSGNTILFEPYIHVLLIPKYPMELIRRLDIHSIAAKNSNHIKQPSKKFKL